MTNTTLAKRIHKQNHQWWHDLRTGKPLQRDKGELLMLVVTELAEAVEGIRKNLMDDHLPHRKMEEVEMADAKIRLLDFVGGFNIKIIPEAVRLGWNFATKNKAGQILEICEFITKANKNCNSNRDCDWAISGAIGAIETYCRLHRLDLVGALKEKLTYNRQRKDHKREARLKANGKKF